MRPGPGPAVGGIAGPILFVAAWLIAGAMEPRYSPVQGAISRLAAVGASTRLLMTAGLLALAGGILLYASALRAAVPGSAWTAAVGTGVATLGVLAFPLGWTSAADRVHGAFAVVAYLTLAATPLLAARPLARSGRPRVASLSVAAGLASALCLAGTVIGVVPGLLQRLGLTVTHGWIVASAAWMLRGVALRPRSTGRPVRP